jgi:hypothetical protein
MLSLVLDPDGGCRFTGLPPLLADALARVPAWLDSDDPDVRARLLPGVYGESSEEEAWRRQVHPELERLFLSRAEIVQRDLESLTPGEDGLFTLRIAPGNLPAWIAALNGARLALFALHRLTAEDMVRDPLTGTDMQRTVALLRINLLAMMQELLIEASPG